ncbi:MAG: inorganic phosphate transporter [Desulfitobacteriaceae bacterium]|nr:inorganic phosphate transporter [Desulfitobacteriaceae bacterium]MDD4402541.1 inorganic phosphate transporter [Desulfitobacteriaceae bacterium]
MTTKLIAFYCRNIKRRVADRFFSYGQIVSVSLMTLSNGAQDGQKFMGIIYFALIIGGIYPDNMSENIVIPVWIKMFCALLMAVGISVGGYRIDPYPVCRTQVS